MVIRAESAIFDGRYEKGTAYLGFPGESRPRWPHTVSTMGFTRNQESEYMPGLGIL